LVAQNEFLCEDIADGAVTVWEVPQALASLDNTPLCIDQAVALMNESLYSDYAMWLVNGMLLDTAWTGPFLFPDTGWYELTLITGNGSGCTDTLTFADSLFVAPSPMAGFTFAEDPMAWPTTFEFISEVSDDVIAYWWEFGDGATSVEADPTHRYLSSFEKEVIQVVANQYDCLDTATAVIDLDQLKGLFIPNVLEPENRMVEEKRYFHPQGIGLEEYHIAIYARNGELVWESSEVDAEGMPSARWDGTFRGQPLQGGTFVWKVHRARFADGSEWQGMVDERGELRRSGFVYLVR